MLASMAAAIEDLRPTEARSEGQRDLAELQQIRDALRKDRVATINRGKHLRTPMGKRLNKQRLRQVDRQLKLIDAEIRRRLGEEKTLERRAEILTSIPGISDITAAGLIVLMPELGTLTGARAASLAGLAPITRESGHWKGRSFIQGGRHRVRRLLFMPALVAVQHNPDLKRKYEALVAKGKPPKVALTAVMRKLLLLANTLVQQDRIWTAQMPGSTPVPSSRRRPARSGAVTDDRDEEEPASQRRRREASLCPPNAHPLDMDTPIFGRKLRSSVAAPAAVPQL